MLNAPILEFDLHLCRVLAQLDSARMDTGTLWACTHILTFLRVRLSCKT